MINTKLIILHVLFTYALTTCRSYMHKLPPINIYTNSVQEYRTITTKYYNNKCRNENCQQMKFLFVSKNYKKFAQLINDLKDIEKRIIKTGRE